MTKKNKREFYLIEELARELRVSNMTIYRYIEAGRLRAYKIGGEFRIDRKDYNNFLNKAKIN